MATGSTDDGEGEESNATDEERPAGDRRNDRLDRIVDFIATYVP